MWNAVAVNHLNDVIHAGVVVIVVICASICGAIKVLDSNTVGNVYLAAVGYAAGRAGSNIRSSLSRASDT